MAGGSLAVLIATRGNFVMSWFLLVNSCLWIAACIGSLHDVFEHERTRDAWRTAFDAWQKPVIPTNPEDHIG